MTTEPTVTIPLALLERAIEMARYAHAELRSTGCASDWDVEQAKQLIADLEAVKATEVKPIPQRIMPSSVSRIEAQTKQVKSEIEHINAREGQKEG